MIIHLFRAFPRLFMFAGVLVFLVGIDLAPAWAAKAAEPVSNQPAAINPFSFILLELGLIVIVALIAHTLSRRYRLPVVLAELAIGIAIGNLLYWLDWSPLFFLIMHIGDAGELFKIVWNSNVSVAEAAGQIFTPAELSEGQVGGELVRALSQGVSPELVLMGIALWLFSNLGVVLLLFKLGLETQIKELVKAEPTAFLVSLTGAAAPFLLGLLVSSWLLSESSTSVHIFVAAALCTTSASISAQLFSNLNRQHSAEARLALDAAFIDDVIGVFLLAIMAAVALDNKTETSEILGLIISAVLFLAATALIVMQLFKRLPAFERSDEPHVKLLIPVAIVFLISWLSDLAQLGAISGAFIAGLILTGQRDSKEMIKQLITPLEKIFAPIFFVFVGMQVNLMLFLDPKIIWLTTLLAAAAILGKMATGLVARRTFDPRIVGLGMVPRGEAVLIFISVGKVLGIVSDSLFSVIVMMVIITNVMTPWALKRVFGRALSKGS